MWDIEQAYTTELTAAYCEDCMAVCAACPRPRLLPVNLPVVAAWMRLCTQWRYAGNGLRTGLDYAGVRAALPWLRVRGPRRRLFEAVQLMEQATLQAQDERWDAEMGKVGEGERGAR